MNEETDKCVFCGSTEHIRGHHIVPKCKGGEEIVPTCYTCESSIHNRWTHKELRDTYNNVEIILKDEEFQRFLKWRKKQSTTMVFKSSPGKFRNKNKYS